MKSGKQFFLEKFGVEEVGLFGSYARNEDANASDIDIIVKLKEPRFSSIVQFSRYLENHFGKEVHLTTIGHHLSQRFLNRIEKEVIYV